MNKTYKMKSEDRPFQKEHLNEENLTNDTFNVRLNKAERDLFDKAKATIEQTKDSTALKQLAFIGVANVLHDRKTAILLDCLFKNKRNNKRLGIIDFE